MDRTIHTQATWIAVAVGILGCARGAAAEGQVAAELLADRVAVTVDGVAFTSYRFAASQKYPYFWPVNGPASGQSVTTESSDPYPHHHSLFFGCDRVNGGNYWQEENDRGQIISSGPKLIERAGRRVVFTDDCLWLQLGQDPVMRDRRRIAISAPREDVRHIDFEVRLEPLTDILIEKTNHSLFSARVVPEIGVASGGTLLNSLGNSGEKETWGVPSPWCDYSGPRDGVVEGIAILQSPRNRWFPCKWFTRDYGFFSPTPMHWLEEGRLELPKGDILTLEYRVVVHAGSATDAGIAEAFEKYRRERELAVSPEAPDVP